MRTAKSRNRRRVLLAGLSILLVLLALSRVVEMGAASTMADHLGHLESIGVLTSTESLVRSEEPVSGDLYLPLIDEVTKDDLMLPNINIYHYGRPWLRKDHLEPWFTKTADLRARIARAADAPALVWIRQKTTDPTIQLTENKHLGELGFILMGEVCYLAMKRDFEGSLQALDRIDKIAVQSMQDPTETGFLEGLVLEDFYFRAATVLLEKAAEDQATLKALQERFNSRPQWPPYKKSLSGTIIATRLKLQHPRYARENMVPFVLKSKTPTSISTGRDPLRYLWASKAFRISEERRFVSLVRRLTDELPDDITDWKARQAAVQNFRADVLKGMLHHTLLNPISKDFDWLSSPVITSALVKRDLLCAAVEVLQKRIASGRLPKALDPRHIDRFSGKSLLYRPTPEGFALYSVSHDGKDNGGAYKGTNHDNDLPVIIHLGTKFW